MAVEGLPEGLVTKREGAVPFVGSDDRVEEEQVAYLWRVYASKRTVLADGLGTRLENYFWRIWSNRRLRQRLSGTQVNVLFEIINEGGFIRTTPTSSPRSTKSLKAYHREARLRTPPKTPPHTEPSSEFTSFTKTAISQQGHGAKDSTSAFAEPWSQLLRQNRPGPLIGYGNIEVDSLTPTPTSPLSAFDRSRRATSPPSVHTALEDDSATPVPTSPLSAHEALGVSSKENRRTSPSSTRRPPILKKGSSGSSRSSNNARVADTFFNDSSLRSTTENEESTSSGDDAKLLRGVKSGLARRATNTRFNEEVAVSIPKPSTSAPRNYGDRMARSALDGNQKSSKRHPMVVSNTGASKTRPTFARQRSAVSAAKYTPSRNTSSQNLARSPKILSACTPSDSSPSQKSKKSPELPSKSKARGSSPHSSKQRRRSSSDSSPSDELLWIPQKEDVTATTTSKVSKGLLESPSKRNLEPTKPLVDPNFRVKFVDKTRAPQRSLTDLTSFSRKSSAVVPTAASFQASGMMDSMHTTSSVGKGKGKGREAFTNVITPLKSPGPSGPDVASEQDTQPLSRTRSHLTLLLEKEKARSTNEERNARNTEP